MREGRLTTPPTQGKTTLGWEEPRGRAGCSAALLSLRPAAPETFGRPQRSLGPVLTAAVAGLLLLCVGRRAVPGHPGPGLGRVTYPSGYMGPCWVSVSDKHGGL